MDHNLRLISYIADIGEILVLMTRRRIQRSSSSLPSSEPASSGQTQPSTTTTAAASVGSAEANGLPVNGVAAVHEELSRLDNHRESDQPSKVICHLFESDEVWSLRFH